MARTSSAAARPTLDRSTLIRVAADEADRVGWANLTLSEVARQVDRHVTSMYAHVDGLDGLRREVALLALGELSDEVWRAAMGRVREDALAAIAEVYRRFGEQHPGRVTAIMTASHHGDDEMTAAGARLAEPIRATFRSFGLDDEAVALAHRVFSATIDGFVRAEATDQYTPDNADAAFHQLVQLFVVALSTGQWPG